MEIIKDSMWKYKLAFDNDLYKVVKRYSFNLQPKQKSCLNFEIDFFRTFFSIDQVISFFSLIKNKKKSVEAFKNVINKRLNYLLFCPVQLYSYYKEIINKKFADNKEHKDWLISVLNHAKNKGITILPRLYYKNILGKTIYKHVVKTCKKYSKRKLEYERNVKIDIGKEKYYIKNYIKNLELKESGKSVWGEYNINNFLIKEDSSFGSGKWLDSRLTYSSTQFIFNTNGIMTEKDCEAQFVKNVYPGNAHFINSILTNKKLFRFDNGSSFLINGWNTFALWHFNPSTYIRNHKYKNSKTITYLFEKKFNQKTIDKIFSHLLTYNNKKVATEKLIKITQFIGLFESSTIGAIAVEYLVDSLGKGPKEFLKWIGKQNVGNYFEDYLTSIKKNK